MQRLGVSAVRHVLGRAAASGARAEDVLVASASSRERLEAAGGEDLQRAASHGEAASTASPVSKPLVPVPHSSAAGWMPSRRGRAVAESGGGEEPRVGWGAAAAGGPTPSPLPGGTRAFPHRGAWLPTPKYLAGELPAAGLGAVADAASAVATAAGQAASALAPPSPRQQLAAARLRRGRPAGGVQQEQWVPQGGERSVPNVARAASDAALTSLASAMLRCDPASGDASALLLARAAALDDSYAVNRVLRELSGDAVPCRSWREHPSRPPSSRAKRAVAWGSAVFEALRLRHSAQQQQQPQPQPQEPLGPQHAQAHALNVHVCTTLVSLFGRQGQWSRARGVFDWMLANGVAPNTFTYSALISAFERGEQHGAALALLRHMDGAGVVPNEVTYCALTLAAARGGSFGELRRLYTRMKARSVRADLTTCNTVLATCARTPHGARAQITLNTFNLMREAGLTPNTVSFNVLISACERGGEWERALDCYDSLKLAGLSPDLITFNTLISVCAKGGQWAAAEECFKRMLQEGLAPKTITFNALISACEKGAALPRALHWFTDMRSRGVDADTITYNALVSCCEKAGRWDTALEVLGWMEASKVAPNTITYSALIAACEKGGEWERALALFDEMPGQGVTPNQITYNSLISACAAGGQWGTALEAYHRMRHSGMEPDRPTYNPLLNVLWSQGQYALAEHLMSRAIEEGVYPQPFGDPPLASYADLHSMSAGAAHATLGIWVRHLRRRYVQPDSATELCAVPPRFHVITGWGKHSRRLGVSEVKCAVVEALRAAGSPFTEHPQNVGMLAADAAEVLAWLRDMKPYALHTSSLEESSSARAAARRERHDAGNNSTTEES